jgi:hypothetical protein
MSIDQLLERYPWIAWTEPVFMVLPERSGFACRVCIAEQGIAAEDVERLFPTRDEFFAHYRAAHDR